MKKSIKIILISVVSLVLVASISVGLYFGLRKRDSYKNPSTDKRASLGAWWWNDELGVDYLDFAKENKVTEIYYCSSKFNEETDLFIKEANKRKIRVYWLAGEYQWIDNNLKLFEKIDKFNEYQKNYKNTFSGIHFDIEPHQNPEFELKRNEILSNFVGLTYILKDKYPNTWIEYDIPFWFDEEVTLLNKTKKAYEHIIDNANRVTLMSYRDTAEAIFKISKDEIEYAKSVGKTINLGVETKSSEGDNVSFNEEGKQVMYAEINKLRELIPNNFGVSIHQIENWKNLKD